MLSRTLCSEVCGSIFTHLRPPGDGAYAVLDKAQITRTMALDSCCQSSIVILTACYPEKHPRHSTSVTYTRAREPCFLFLAPHRGMAVAHEISLIWAVKSRSLTCRDCGWQRPEN